MIAQGTDAKEAVVAEVLLGQRYAIVTLQLQEPFPYVPGQYAELEDTETQRKSPFSIAKGSTERKTLVFCISVAGVSDNISRESWLIRGRKILVGGPFGDFKIVDPNKKVAMIAGGSGVAPFLSFAHQLCRQSQFAGAALALGVRHDQEIPFEQELHQLATQSKGEFEFLPAAQEGTRRDVHKGSVVDHITNLVPKYEHFYVCGPSSMVEAARDQLSRLGIEKVFVESY